MDDSPFKSPFIQTPKKIPKIGGVDMEGNAWVGGKPNMEWDMSENTRAKSIYCYRIGRDIRQYKERIQGMTVKFGSDENYSLHTFANNVGRHLELHGMDSVFMFHIGTLCTI
jgi:hypothetical protein